MKVVLSYGMGVDSSAILEDELSSWIQRGGLAPLETDLAVDDYSVKVKEVTKK